MEQNKPNQVPILSVRELTVQFGGAGSVKTAVDRVDLEIAPGEIVGLVGESGSGKTTLGRSIVGLNDITAGEVIVDGKTLPRDSSSITGGFNRWLAGTVQMVFQDPVSSLHPRKTVKSIIAEGLFALRSGKTEADDSHFRQALKASDGIVEAALANEPRDDALRAIANEQSVQVALIRGRYGRSVAQNDPASFVPEAAAAKARKALTDLRDDIASNYDHLEDNRLRFTAAMRAIRTERAGLPKLKSAEQIARRSRILDDQTNVAVDHYVRRKRALRKANAELIAKLHRLANVKRKEASLARASQLSDDQRKAIDKLFADERASFLRDVDAGKAKFAKFAKQAEAIPADRVDNKAETNVSSFANTPMMVRRRGVEGTVARLLKSVQLDPEYMGRYALELSGGQQQRVAIARAIAVQPRLLVADEPISALDVSIQAQVVNIIKDLNQNEGLSVLFIAHDLRMVHYISDRIAVMEGGRILETGLADEVFKQAVHPYTKALLRAVPSTEDVGVKLTGERPVFDDGADRPLFWHYVTKTHRVLATEDDAKLWGLKPLRTERAIYGEGY